MTTKTEQNTTQRLTLSASEFDALFRRLNLANMRRTYREVARRAEQESWSYADFLALLLAEEVAKRKQTRLQRCTRSAHFPFFKTLDDFDFSRQRTLRKSLLGSYLGLDFVTEGRSLVLHGKEGRGKTHLAVAIGYRAIQNGFETLFTTAAELIEDLSNASQKGRLHESVPFGPPFRPDTTICLGWQCGISKFPPEGRQHRVLAEPSAFCGAPINSHAM